MHEGLIRGRNEPIIPFLPSCLQLQDMPDPTTQANYLQIFTKHVHFNWTLDFSNQIIEGTATHTLLARESGVEEVMYFNAPPSSHRIDHGYLKL
jgi:hypothetical protein